MRRFIFILIILFVLSPTITWAAISLDGSGTGSGLATATSLGLSISSGSVVVGDVIKATIATRCENTGFPDKIEPPAGWTLAGPPNASGCGSTSDVGMWTYVRIADNSDVAKPTYTFTDVSGATNASQAGMVNGIIRAWSGVNNKYWHDYEQGTAITSASATLTALPVNDMSSASDAHEVCYVFATATATASNTTPTGYTLIGSVVANTAASPNLYLSCFYNLTPTFTTNWTAAITSTIGSAGTGLSASESQTLLPKGVEPYGVTEEPFVVGNVVQPPPDPPVSGTTFFIDNSFAGYNGTQAPTGACAAQDALNGQSWANAWCTFAHFNAQTIAAGSKIVLACGDTWHEQFSLNAMTNGTGTARSVVTFGSSPNNSLPACNFGKPSFQNIGYVSGNLPTIDVADEIGPNGGGDRLITASWTACGVGGGPCPNEPATEYYLNIGSTYNAIDGVFVTDTPQGCPGAGCPAPAARTHPIGGLARAADLSVCTAGLCEPGSGLAVQYGAGSNGGNSGGDSDGSGELAKIAQGGWLYVPLNDGGGTGDVGIATTINSAAQAAGSLTITVTATSTHFSNTALTSVKITGLTPSACNGTYPETSVTSTTVVVATPTGCTGTITVSAGTVQASAPADVSPGYLYVWLGDGSSPNNHKIEVTTRIFGFGGSTATPLFDSSHGSFTTIRGHNIIHAQTCVGVANSTHQLLMRYFRGEWLTCASGADGIADALATYNNGIRLKYGTNAVMEHSTISGTYDHGNATNMQDVDYYEIRFDDHSYTNHDTDDTKACDGSLNYYNNIHDSWTEPGLRTSGTTSGIQGSYFESSAAINLRASWSSATTVNPYDSWGYFEAFCNMYNIDAFQTGSLGGGAAVHWDTLTDGIYILNNSIHMTGRNNTIGCIYGTGQNSGQIGNVYNNICDNISSAGSSAFLSGSGTLNESNNNWGLNSNNIAPITHGITQSTYDVTSRPTFVLPLASDNSPPCGAAAAFIGSTTKGLASYAGAFAPLACSQPGGGAP